MLMVNQTDTLWLSIQIIAVVLAKDGFELKMIMEARRLGGASDSQRIRRFA